MGKADRIFVLTNLDTSESKQVEVADGDEIEERHFRSIDYNSVLRSDTLPIKFPNDGGRFEDNGGYFFILDAKDIKGVKTRIQLTVSRLNPHTNDYDQSFQGMLEFNPRGGYSQEEEYINVKAVDSRKLAKFKERDEIDYNVFSLVSSDNVTVPDFTNPYTEATYKKIDVYLECQSNGIMPVFRFPPLTSDPGADVQFLPPETGDWAYNGIVTVNEMDDRLDIENDWENFSLYNNNLTQPSIIQDVLIDSDIEVHVGISTIDSLSGTARLSFAFDVYDEESVLVVTALSPIETLFYNLPNNAPSVFDIGQSTTGGTIPDILIPAGGYVEFSLRLSIDNNVGTINNVFAYMTEGNNQVSKFNFYEKTLGWEDNQIRGMYPYEVASRLLQLTTSETDTARLLDSSILGRTNSEFQSYSSDGHLSREFATNGFQLRQFVDRALNINFKDWFRSLSAISPIGLWYDKTNDIFKIEDIEEFYKSEMFPIDLGQGTDIVVTDFKGLYFNTILSGYPKTEYEDFGGVNETNTQTEHEISIEEKTKYDVRSRLYGDSMGKELARRKNKSKFASEDTKYDNQVSLTTLNTSDETIQGGLSNLEGYKGVEESYNLWKTSRQNLQRQSPLLIAPLYKDVSEIITFRKSVKDTNISYTDPLKGDSVTEFDNITQAGLRARLIDPELSEFEGLYTEEIANEIVKDPHRIMPYSDKDGNPKYGYIWDIVGNRIKGKAVYKLIKVNPDRLP